MTQTVIITAVRRADRAVTFDMKGPRMKRSARSAVMDVLDSHADKSEMSDGDQVGRAELTTDGYLKGVHVFPAYRRGSR